MSTRTILYLSAGAFMSLSMVLRTAPSTVLGELPDSDAISEPSRDAKLTISRTLNATPNSIIPRNIIMNATMMSANSTRACPLAPPVLKRRRRLALTMISPDSRIRARMWPNDTVDSLQRP
jgi:hypothetical protein